ncbi:MAG: HDOD domain-containing protein [FCB group bacterium]|jgi:putative nucleotidyltransferase with HDIG domain|nr:HDOD domain-containing protein [FCB group bacterium]
MTRDEIEALLDEVVTLPSLPRNINHITQLVNAPDTALAELGQAIAVDPAFAIKTLRLANSASYGRRNPVTSVDLAVTMLGVKVIRNLVFTAMIGETLRGAESLLRHSVGCGLAMQLLAERQGPASPLEPDEAFTYGLLHDIGKVVFKTYAPAEGAEAERVAQERGISLNEAERSVLGLDHAELGAMLAARWRLPEQLTEAIAGHHRISACSDPVVRRIAATLALADSICSFGGLPAGTEVMDEIGEEDWELTQMRKSDLPMVLDDFFASLISLDELIGLAA